MNATRPSPRISSQPAKVDTRGAEAALFLLLVAILGTVLIETAGGPRTMMRMSAGLWSGSLTGFRFTPGGRPAFHFAAIKRQRGEALEVADQVTLKADVGIFPRSDLLGALLRRLVMESFPAVRDSERIEAQRGELHRCAEVIRHLRMLREDESSEVVVRRREFRRGFVRLSQGIRQCRGNIVKQV